MNAIAAVFFCLGAIDYLLNNRFGLGKAFREGLDAIVELLFLMTGFIALAPWLNNALAPVVGPFFKGIGCDPSLFAGMLLSCDSGGAVLGAAMASDATAGLYNGMVVGAFLGINVMITIPLVLENTRGSRQVFAVQGLLIGFLTLPVGCVITGLLAGIPVSIILANTWPVLAISLLLLVLFKVCGNRILSVFKGFSFFIRFIALGGFSISVVQEFLNFTILPGLTPLSEIFPVICHIGVFLAGILPFMALMRRLLKKPLGILASRLQINTTSMMGLIICAANPIPVMLDSDALDEKGCMLNVAFLTPACFAAGDFLAFSMQYYPPIAIPLMIGKLLTGLLGLTLAFAFDALRSRSTTPAPASATALASHNE
ncbi:ethanolamine utilization protein EutH [Eubacterium barkeri]|uniref:Ethanolamine transporter n=1 Tax=Eubacterium barkeri TaxID=1528 RepID=A0A1H3APD1_EUBBA|nr:ethanolamine utilization protein EutH [Eubacterium barkeri]SDX31261.1 ethanolamine transporter [Eubacterium barkeri]